MRAATTALALGLFSSALNPTYAKQIEPSDAKLRQVAADLYPAIIAREELEAPFVVGLVFDADLRVISHSGSIPPRRGISAALLPEMFPRQHAECEPSGFATIRSPRGVGGQFDKGVFAAWCVLPAK